MSRKLIGIVIVTNGRPLNPISLPNVRPHREKDEVDEVKMAALSDLEKKSSFRSSTKPDHEMQAAEEDWGDVAVQLEMVQVNPVHDEL